jgi:uncharacterized protein (TIGR03086 family)
MTMIDLSPAARTVADLVRSVRDDELDGSTPCPVYTVGDLVDHIGGLAVAFTAAARKDTTFGQQQALGDASRLEPGWRDRIATDLEELARAWKEPDSWTGMCQAGGVEMPGGIGGLVALDEVVVHGWDLARGLGRPYEVDDASLQGARSFLEMFSGPGQEDQRGDAFGPVVAVPDSAPLLDRVVGLSGRDPGWRKAV